MALEVLEAKPGPPVVSISTTRATPKALGLLHVDATGAGAAWAITINSGAAPGARMASARALVTAGACPSAGAAWVGKGAGPETEVFCNKIAPKIAAQTTIASADTIAARRMSDLWDAAGPRTPWTEFQPISLIPHLSGQFEAPRYRHNPFKALERSSTASLIDKSARAKEGTQDEALARFASC
jgi:hypothetical protein